MGADTAATAPRARRGRPPTADLPEVRREQIVRAAYEALTEGGYDRTSMADIARRAGVGHGTVYRYFHDKRQLLDHVFDYAVTRTIKALDLRSIGESEVAHFTQSLMLIELFGWRLFALIDADPGLLRLITVESSAIDPELRYRVVGMIGTLDAGMALLFESAGREWAATADPRVRRTFGHMMLAMSGPGLAMSLGGVAGAEQRRTCLATVSAIADRGLLTADDDSPVDDEGDSRPAAPTSVPDTPLDAAQRPSGEASPRNPGARRRAELYAAAWDLFLDNGYRDVDVADIARRAGVSQGTFYNYFTNKRAVLDLMIAQVHAELQHTVTPSLSVNAPATRDEFVCAVKTLVRDAVGHLALRGPTVSFVALTAPGVDQAAFASTLAGFTATSAMITSMLAQGRDRGWVRTDIDLGVAGQAVACCVVAAVLPALLDEAHVVDVEISSRVCSCYLLGGMRAAARVDP